MLATMLEYLQKHLGVATKFILECGQEVFDREVYNPPRLDLPLPTTRTFSTLAGLAQFVTENPDGLFLDVEDQWMIHIVSPNVVELVNAPDPIGQRDVRIRANCPTQKDAEWLDRWVSQENLLIGLLGCAPGGDRDKLAEGVQSIKREGCEVHELKDGGQKVTANVGIGLTDWLRTDATNSKENGLDLNKVVRLAPFRTFSEIEQPLGTFVFRIKGSEGLTQVKLIPTPDATWAFEAVTAVKAKLDELLEGVDYAPPVIC